MTVAAIAGHFRQLLTGDPSEWRHLPYRFEMKLRGIDLTWVSAEESGVAGRGSWHSNSGGPDLDLVLRSLQITCRDAAIDLGCGKGGALITMARYPFQRVDGVELSPRLAEVALTNIRKLRIRNASVFCRDAAEFSELDAYTHVYMYNPFPESIMRCVMQNLDDSLGRRARKLTLIYKNPLCEDLAFQLGFRPACRFGHCSPPFSVLVKSPRS